MSFVVPNQDHSSGSNPFHVHPTDNHEDTVHGVTDNSFHSFCDVNMYCILVTSYCFVNATRIYGG